MGDFSVLGFPFLRSEIMASSSSSSSTSLVCSSSLTDDILLEIFTYLPLKSINKFKCLSKVWLSNFSHPSFIIKWFRTNNKSLLWIQYHSIPNQRGNPLRLRYAYPESHSEFMTSNEHFFSLKFLIDKKPFQGAKVFTLGSSNGILLCYSFLSEYQKRYHVCNPLTQKWVSLPSPPGFNPISNLDVNGIFCEYSSSFTSCCFWVVRIPTFYVPSKEFNVDIFSSDLGVWQSFQVLCDKDVTWSRSRYVITVILNGVLFWIDGLDRMLVYNFIQNNGSDGHRCSLIDLPEDDGDKFESILGESEGCLCYGRVTITDEELTMSVWVLNEVNWKIMHKNVSLGPVFVEAPSLTSGFARIRVLGFSPVDRNVVLLGWTQKVWGFNVQTRNVDDLSLGNAYDYDLGKPYLPFVLKPMPTVFPICKSNPEVKERKKRELQRLEWNGTNGTDENLGRGKSRRTKKVSP